ncbi:MAG: hypothetical protein RIT45_2218 [Pseudomonadota bacterium]
MPARPPEGPLRGGARETSMRHRIHGLWGFHRLSAGALALSLWLASTTATAQSALPPPAAPTPPSEQPEADGPPVESAQPPAEPGVLDPPQPAQAPLPPQGRQLSPADQRILDRGPISGGAWALGGVLGTWMGFGLGHLAQGRYDDGGLLFTFGEIASISMMIVALGNASSSDLTCDEFGCRERVVSSDAWATITVVSGLTFAALRIWEIIDVWYAPAMINQRYDAVRRMAQPNWSLMVVPAGNDGAQASFALRF